MLHEPPQDRTPNESRIKALTVEYSAPKAEIHGRSRDQLLCITATFVAVGTLFGVGLQSESHILLLLLPWLLGIFGVIWYDHDHWIHYIAQYIRENIDSVIRPDESGWETYIANRRAARSYVAINEILPWILFILPSACAYIGYFCFLDLHICDDLAQEKKYHPGLIYTLTGLGIISLGAMILKRRIDNMYMNTETRHVGH